MSTKNVFQKLQSARIMLNEVELKKSGNNQHLKFNYFELQDFIPEVNRIFDELGLIGITDFADNEKVFLRVINTEKPEEMIVFSIDKSDAGLRSGTPIQNTGAQQTYLRRYLWVQAMELTENDAIDTLGNDDKITQADANRQKAQSADKQQAISYKESLTVADTTEKLRAAYKLIPAKFRTGDIEAYAKKRADELTPVEDKIRACTSMDQLTELCDKLSPEQNAEYSALIAGMIDGFSFDIKG